MAKNTFADKLAGKAFNSPAIQKSWAAHMQAFGPILEPAFAEDYQSRVHLTAALNLIGNCRLSDGLEKLQALKVKCENDADKAALLFFMGLCHERAGREEQMLECYSYANEYEHRFCLPYLKVAKFYLSHRVYDTAAENYRRAIACMDASDETQQNRLLLGSAYANYASCLTMMHRYEEAEAALSASRTVLPDFPGRIAIEAALCAIRGDTAQVEACLTTAKNNLPHIYEQIKASTDRILARTDALFYPVPVDEEKISRFWQWFAEQKAELLRMLDGREYEAAVSAVAEQLLLTFPFMEEKPYISLGQNEEGYVLELRDLFAIGLTNAYEKLLQARPAEGLESRFFFVVIH